MLVFLAQHYALATCAWTLFPFAARFAVPLAAVLAISSWTCALIAHNALHCPLFDSRRTRGAFQIVLSCAYGFPVSEYLPGHNLSHHRHLEKQADVMRTTKARFVRLNALNLIYFAPRVVLDVFRQNRQYVAATARRAPAWYRQRVRESIACWGTKAVLLALDWKRALAFVVLPQLFAVYAITTVNLIQHDGCDEDHPVNHSRNFVGKIFNWFTFNSGFHGVHHDEPSLHWSLLPAAHRERYHGRVAPALEQRSLLRYLLRTYVLAARRRRFDGTPMARIVPRPDEDWIPRRDESASASAKAA
jgi:fatty acid desaturase